MSQRYIGPFKVRTKVGDVDYRLILPLELSRICNVFHVSVLKKFADHSYVLVHEPLEIKEDAPYVEKHVQIIDIKEKIPRTRTIHLVKIKWENHIAQMKQHENFEFTYRSSIPTYFLRYVISFRGPNFLSGGGSKTSILIMIFKF